METIEKGKTVKYLKEKHQVPPEVTENLKTFTRIKKSILDALKEQELTIAQLSEKLNMSKKDTTFYVMTLIKYGFIEPAGIDDMDEYYSYKIKNNGKG